MSEPDNATLQTDCLYVVSSFLAMLMFMDLLNTKHRSHATTPLMMKALEHAQLVSIMSQRFIS
jgi:hypothetical protein